MTNAAATNVSLKAAEKLMFLNAVPVIKNHLPAGKSGAADRPARAVTPPARDFAIFPAGRKNFSRVYSFSVAGGVGDNRQNVRGAGDRKSVRKNKTETGAGKTKRSGV